MAQINIIGSGFSGLSAACYAAHKGYRVSVFEKNNTIGGRSRSYSENGFMFDMGPSWYWMPDVFEDFFTYFGKSSRDYYNLVPLDPGFQIIFNKNESLKIPAKVDDLLELVESIEKGSAKKLKQFLAEGKFKYSIGMKDLVHKPALSWMEYMNYPVIKGAIRSHIFKSMRKYVRSYFKDERLIALMEFPVLFLGAMPNHIPALYSLMNYAALSLGTWYPMGGMYQIVTAMEKLASSLGVEFHTSCEVKKIDVRKNKAIGIETSLGAFNGDSIIATADYHHVESHLLDKAYRNYSENYWQKKTLAPSCLIYYIGVNKKINRLLHHNLFFDTNFEEHAEHIYKNPQWPKDPLFYLCCPSKTDSSVAPKDMENMFILIPIATDLKEIEIIREHYFKLVIKRIESWCGEEILPHVIYKKSYCINDFIKDYNSYKGNAYGLANTLKQTAVLKPSIRNKKIKNLFYAGQLTVPGPGVPPAIISGKIAVEQLTKYLKNHFN